MSDTIQTALPESEGRLRALAVDVLNTTAQCSHDDAAENAWTAYHAAALPDAVLALLDELARLRAEVRQWTQYATDNAEVAVRATTDAERLRVSLVEARRATEILRRAGSPMSNLCFNLAQQRGNIDASWCDSANGCRMAWDKAIERAAALPTAEVTPK